MSAVLPPLFERWFAARGWRARPHQLAVAAVVAAGRSVLLIAPTGGGKTLAGFLPSLVELYARPAAEKGKLHTLYISPLKALAVDIASDKKLTNQLLAAAGLARKRADLRRKRAT